MYALIWRHIPGPGWLRALVMLLLFAAVIAACFTWLFPWVATVMPFNDQTVGHG